MVDEDDHEHDDEVQSNCSGNEVHIDGLPSEHFSAVKSGQHPEVVSVCCSDSRVPQERMWGSKIPERSLRRVTSATRSGTTTGRADRRRGVLYPIHHAGTEVAAIVGHTGCGAVTAAYDVATGADEPGPRVSTSGSTCSCRSSKPSRAISSTRTQTGRR
ncbi:hypothetical protein D8S78_19435 [Natrialba swarupiae]|nr:hypothetical protein [Natrialba swarupiae]